MKKIILRGILGVPLGIAIGYMITVLVSVFAGDGNYYPVTQELLNITSNELSAVILQVILCGIMGAGFALASIIWEIDSWSLVKQTGIYFAIICVVMFPISYFAGWMPHTMRGIVLYVLIFIVIFIVAWILQYMSWKNKIGKLNDKVKNK